MLICTDFQRRIHKRNEKFKQIFKAEYTTFRLSLLGLLVLLLYIWTFIVAFVYIIITGLLFQVD